MARVPLVVGNWKLHKTSSEAVALVTELKNHLATVRDVEIGVAPVFPSLAAVSKRLEGSNVGVFGQDCWYEERGAFTGEVSPSLLLDAGARGVIVGHSERRHILGEDDELIARKLAAALAAGLTSILCVGETEAERDSGQTQERVTRQIEVGLAGVREGDVPRLVIAYEPVWAIGTGRTATPAQAQEVHGHIRELLRQRLGGPGDGVRIQYGGSVKPDNAGELLRQADIDGALVGGASLTAEDFTAIVKSARLVSGQQIS